MCQSIRLDGFCSGGQKPQTKMPVWVTRNAEGNGEKNTMTRLYKDVIMKPIILCALVVQMDHEFERYWGTIFGSRWPFRRWGPLRGGGCLGMSLMGYSPNALCFPAIDRFKSCPHSHKLPSAVPPLPWWPIVSWTKKQNKLLLSGMFHNNKKVNNTYAILIIITVVVWIGMALVDWCVWMLGP